MTGSPSATVEQATEERQRRHEVEAPPRWAAPRLGHLLARSGLQSRIRRAENWQRDLHAEADRLARVGARRCQRSRAHSSVGATG